MLTLIIAVLVVLIGSAVCSCSETVLLSIPLMKVRQLAQSKSPASLALLTLREKINRSITTVVILNNIFNIVGSITIGRLAAALFDDAILGLFSGVLTFCIIVFSEILPKTVGERYAESLALWIAIPLAGLTWLMRPAVWLVEFITAPLTKGAKRPVTDEAEIQFLARIGRQEGIIEEDEAEMIQRVFRLNDMAASDLMTPRTAMTYLQGDRTLADAKSDIIRSQHSRIIVVDDAIDRVTGVVLKHVLLTAMLEGWQDEKVSRLARSVQFVPETIRADKLLAAFQASREHLVVVLDEYGGVSGVVTLEDVLEVLTGEIVDETDRAIDLQEWARQRRRRLFKLADPVLRKPR